MTPWLALFLFACSPADPDTDDTDDTDVSDDDVPREDALVALGALRPPNGAGAIHLMDVALRDDLALTAAYRGLMVFDLSDPAAPVQIGLPRGRALYWVTVDGDDVVTSGRSVGVFRLGLGDDGTLTPGASNPDEIAEGAAVHGDEVLVAAGGDGLLRLATDDLFRFDAVSDPTNAIDVEVGDGAVFVGDRDLGLVAFDSTLTNRLGEVPLGGAVQDLALLGDDRVVAAASGRVEVIDVSDPTAPIVIHSVASDGVATRVAVDGDLIAVANYTDTRLYTEDLRLVAVQDAEQSSVSVAMADGLLVVGDWDWLRTFEVHPDRRSPEIALPAQVVLAGDGPAETTAVLRNDGDLTLHVTDVFCDDGITLTPTAVDVAPFGQTGLTVAADLTGPVYAEADCRIVSDDADEPTATLPVRLNPPGLTLGLQAPDWTEPDLWGSYHSLSDFGGKVVLLTLFSSI